MTRSDVSTHIGIPFTTRRASPAGKRRAMHERPHAARPGDPGGARAIERRGQPGERTLKTGPRRHGRPIMG